MIKYILIVFLTISLISCKNDVEMESKTEDIISIEDYNFTAKLVRSDHQMFSRTMTHDIYIYPEQRNDSLLITRNAFFQTIPIKPEKYSKLNIPQNAVLSFSNFLENLGSVYYGIADKNVLKIYKGISKRKSADSIKNDTINKYELFKSFEFKKDEIIAIEH